VLVIAGAGISILALHDEQRGRVNQIFLMRRTRGTPKRGVSATRLGAQAGVRNARRRAPIRSSEPCVAATLYDVLRLTLRFAGQAITGQSELIVDLRLIYVPGRRGCHSLDASSVLRRLGDDLLSFSVRAVLGHFRRSMLCPVLWHSAQRAQF
jgi:hypothetical protein